MKKVLSAAIFFFFILMTADAQVQRDVNPSQNTASNNDKKDKQIEIMKELNLTKEQKGQIKEFRRSMKQTKEQISNDTTLSPQQKEIKMKELRRQQKEKLNSILTPEQQEKLKEERKNAKMKKGIPAEDSTGNNS